MLPVRRILVAIKDPNVQSSPAVAKAAQLARAFEAQVHLFHAITAPVYSDLYGLSDKSPDEIERDTRNEALARLQAIATRLRGEGLEVTTAAEWDFPAYEPVLREARQGKADLIVTEPHVGHKFAPFLLHHTDWELLRLSPVPVLLVKGGQAYREPVVLAAVDPAHAYAKPSGLDDEILGAASAFSSALGGELHAVHAYVPLPVGLLDLEPRVARRLERDSTGAARARLDRAARSASIPLTRRHLELNAADEAIRDTAKKTGSSIVVMGAVSRSGLKRLFIGNTAERTVDALDCDVLIIKPTSFANRITRNPRGSRRRVIAPMLAV